MTSQMTEQEVIKAIAIDWVCPLNHNPTTTYEKDEVKRLLRFAEDIILALNKTREVNGIPSIHTAIPGVRRNSQ